MHIGLNGISHRGFLSALYKIGKRRYSGQYIRKKDIQYGTDRQGAQDTDRHIFLGVFGFLRRSRYGIETDKSKEHDRSAFQHPAPAVVEEGGIGIGRSIRLDGGRRIGRDQIRVMIGRVDEMPANRYENQYNRNLYDNDDGVHERRLLGSLNEQKGQHREDKEGWEIDDPCMHHSGDDS